LKIDMISEHASPLATLGGADAGGQNVHVAALACALARQGHEIRIFTRRDDPDLAEAVLLAPGVTVEHVPAGPAQPVPKDELPANMPGFANWLSWRWTGDPPDVAHAHFWMSGLAAVTAAARCGVPVVQTFHALGRVKRRYQAAADTSPPQRVSVESSVGQSADAIIATCTDEVRELGAYGVASDRTYVVPCGVDCTHFRPDGPAARLPGVPGAPEPRILTLGRLVPRKGVDTVIAALAGVPDARLLVAGGPPAPLLAQDPEVRRLRGIADSAGVAGRVTFLGQVAHDDVPALLRTVDVVVLDPWYEPFGLVALEAMACGAPVVVSAVGGHLDTVPDGIVGLLVPPQDAAALAERLRQLLADPAMRAALGRAGVARARSRYSWDRIAADTLAVYAAVRPAWAAVRAQDGANR
jgi:D-inositol-3-phosphate glycosyltransferase